MTNSPNTAITRLTAAAIIQRSDGYFLFVEEPSQGRFVFNQPSGTWEPGETLPQTASREAAEEAGVIFQPTSFLGMFVTHHRNSSGVNVCSIRAAFAGEILPGAPGVPRDPTIIRSVWMSYDEIMQHRERHRSSAVMRCLDVFQSGKLLPMESLNEMDDVLRAQGGAGGASR